MAKKFPIDEFDKLPPHGGRHRIRRTASVRVREFFGYMLAAAVIASVGFFALTWADSSNIFSGTVQTVAEPGDPLKANAITVLDATGEDGVAGTLAHKLLDKNWKVVAADNAVSEADETTIFINASTLTPAAEELIKDLGKYPISVSAEYTDPITVLIGKDFKK
jgi:hypothetical protein